MTAQRFWEKEIVEGIVFLPCYLWLAISIGNLSFFLWLILLVVSLIFLRMGYRYFMFSSLMKLPPILKAIFILFAQIGVGLIAYHTKNGF